MLVEKICVGGVGIFVFYILVGVGIFIVEGKEVCVFDGKEYLLEEVLKVDFSLVRVWKVDYMGNLVYNKIVCNFSLMIVVVGKVMIVEVEEFYLIGLFDLNIIYIFSVYV